jgi:4,5-dihydroxyphthalate decarboxylase
MNATRENTMARLSLTMACDAPTLAPLLDGSVVVPDVDLRIEEVQPEQRHHRMLHDLAFDVCEYSSINYLSDWHSGLPFTAIPVFPYRTFRHRDVWVSRASGITAPSQLAGKRVGLQSWANSAALWQRGALQHDFALDLGSVEWVANLPEGPGFRRPEWLRLARRPEGHTLDDLVADGGLDAMMVPWPARFTAEQAERVQRLFPDYVAVEQEYFERSGAFPIMHVVVVKNTVLAEPPWVAERLFDSLRRAIDTYVERQRAANAPSPIWGGLTWEDQERRVGPQPWPSGLEPNRAALQTMAAYALEQGVLAQPVGVDDLFRFEGRPHAGLG